MSSTAIATAAMPVSVSEAHAAMPVPASAGHAAVLGAVSVTDVDEVVGDGVGLRVRAEDREALALWLAKRLRAVGAPDLATYLGLLRGPGDAALRERERLTIRLTTGETYFLRDPAQFDLIGQRLLPELIAARVGCRRLRLWSAGCATGEEAYTLAMLLAEQGAVLADWDVEILATDINSAALAAAGRGRFGEWSFRALDEGRRRRYFVRDGDEWVVADALRDRIRFAHADLVGGAVPLRGHDARGFDLILCRNVFIYMDAAVVGRVAAALAAALGDTGYLVTGHGELIGTVLPGLQTRVFPGGVVHQMCAPGAPKPETGPRTDLPAGEGPAGEGPAPPTPADVPLRGPDPLATAWAFADRGEAARAEALARQAMAAAPLDPWPHYLLAQLAQESGDRAGARVHLERVVYLDAELVAGHLELAALHRREGGMSRAVRSLEAARRLLDGSDDAAMVRPYERTTAGELRAFVDRELRQLRAAP